MNIGDLLGAVMQSGITSSSNERLKSALGGGQRVERVPLGLRKPQTEADEIELEQHSETVLKAMINAAKADGRIDEEEIRRIVGKLQEVGADTEGQRYVMTQMQKPLETENLISAAEGLPELAAQIYAASLMAIEVDTLAEKAYLTKLASGLGLTPEVTRHIDQMVGLQPV